VAAAMAQLPTITARVTTRRGGRGCPSSEEAGESAGGGGGREVGMSFPLAEVAAILAG
jgi:hypothetical protein